MKKAINLIENLKLNNEPVILACSYGPDSMVLLDLLLKLKVNVIVAHVNHKVRDESDAEEKALKTYCNKNNIPFELKILKEVPETNFEMRSRVIRYDFFESLLIKYNSKYLFTGHHGDDLIETVLMRIIRGSRLKGYGGFDYIKDKETYKIIRPLIYYSKEDILYYAKENKINYAKDYTNESEDYFRNRIRKNILPELKKENNEVHLKFLDFNEKINEYEEYFKEETKKVLKKVYKDNYIYIKEFNKEKDIIKKRIIQEILKELYTSEIYLITDNHISLIIDLINSEKQNTYVSLPLDLSVIKEYNKLIFKFNVEEIKPYNYLLKDIVNLSSGKISIIKESNDTSNYVIRLSAKEIKLPLYIRTHLKGDKMKVKNLNGSKSIASIFVDNKNTKNERKSWPILVDSNNEILWIPGLKKSVFDKQKNETYDIIIKYEKKESMNEEKN